MRLQISSRGGHWESHCSEKGGRCIVQWSGIPKRYLATARGQWFRCEHALSIATPLSTLRIQ